jgi:hypothetical protein
MLNLVRGTVRLKHTYQAIVSHRDGTAQANTTIIKANKQATYAIPAAQFPTPNSRTPNQTIKKKGQEYPKTTENNITVDAITNAASQNLHQRIETSQPLTRANNQTPRAAHESFRARRAATARTRQRFHSHHTTRALHLHDIYGFAI